MAAAKRQQSNVMLYTIITFVGLFIIATTVAVIYYVKAEKYRTARVDLQRRIDDLATKQELQRMGAIVGTKQPGKSRLGTMSDYLDKTVSLIIGGPLEETSAEVKVNTVNREVEEALVLLTQEPLETKAVTRKVPTNEFVELLVKEQFSTAAENFDETMKNALPSEKLEGVWRSTIAQGGPFKRQIGVRTEKQLTYNIVFVTCEFEKGPLDIKIVYNSAGQISGLFFVPTPEEVLKNYRGTSELPAQRHPAIENIDPNTTGLTSIISELQAKLNHTMNEKANIEQHLNKLQQRFDDTVKVSFEKEQTLLAEKEKYHQQVNDITQKYDELKLLMEQTSEQQAQTLRAQLEEERDNVRKLNQELLRTQAELKMAQDRMRGALEKLQQIKPLPEREVVAYQSDGKIILIDEQAGIVHLDIGTDDHVYQGLTFSVYDKHTPIPKDGKGKAEIEIFGVAKNFSAARITHSQKRNPIAVDDTVANLIWDSDKTNVFVVAGEFDLDGNGSIDYDAIDRIKALIEKWGGTVADTISIDTDFLVLGSQPPIPEKPTFEDLEMDPLANIKYDAALQKLDHYKEVQNRAQTLWIPVFNYERFLYFIGYKGHIGRPGAF